MHPYSASARIKQGLIAAAVVIAVASLVFTNRLADRLQAQDAAAVQLWAAAIEFQGRASGHAALTPDLSAELDSVLSRAPLGPAERQRLRDLAADAAGAAGAQGLDFVATQIVGSEWVSVPAIITDSARTVASAWRNVEVDGDGASPEAQRRLLALAAGYDDDNAPIRLEVADGFVQFVHYGESELAAYIRLFPLVQLGVVALFVLVGYLGFSYVRRTEQSSLWVGMAKEAAHQLGTPISSIIGWVELLRLGPDAVAPETVADELDRDVDRLRRVADRFEKIGSTPDLEAVAVAPVLSGVADYIRHRVPRSGPPVSVTVDADAALGARLNVQLFEWVVENLLKNALDAMHDGGAIRITAREHDGRAVIDVADTGKGMDRRTARNVFRPGFSTKRRGWGLGLSLARRIVETYHGGSLAVESTRPGSGTTFRITLDAVEPAGKPAVGERLPGRGVERR